MDFSDLMAGLALGSVSYFWTLARAATALMLAWAVVVWLNHALGFRFGEWLRAAAGQPPALYDGDDEDIQPPPLHVTGTGGMHEVEIKTEPNPVAVAIYLGLRWLGVCILLAWLLS